MRQKITREKLNSLHSAHRSAKEIDENLHYIATMNKIGGNVDPLDGAIKIHNRFQASIRFFLIHALNLSLR